MRAHTYINLKLYSVEQWSKFVTESPDTAYPPIGKPLIKKSNNAEFPLKGEEDMCITSKATLFVNINELWSQGYEVDDDNKPVPDNIPNPETQKDTQT